MNPIYRINPSLEALRFKDTLGIFVGDKTLTFHGPDSFQLFERIKTLFSVPHRACDIETLDPEIAPIISRLIDMEVLVEDAGCSIELYGSGSIINILRNMLGANLPSDQHDSLLICIPDTKGLAIQKEALASLRIGQGLLTGIRRGTSVFLLPPMHNSGSNMVDMLVQVLSTEPGVANLYLVQELMSEETPVVSESYMSAFVARWIAADILALVANRGLDRHVARIYRGSRNIREDVLLMDQPVYIPSSDTVEEKVEHLSKAIVGNGKIVGRFYLYVVSEEEPRLYMAYAHVARARTAMMREREGNNAWGAGTTRGQALLPTFMEALERYAIEAYSVDDYPLCSRNELSHPVLDRMDVAGYGADDEFLPDLSPGTPRRWHLVQRFTDGAQFVVPLELIRYPVTYEEIGYKAVDGSTSSGVAAHFARSEAITSACHELVERDAFMIAWLRAASPPTIRISSMPKAVKEETAMLQGLGLKVCFIDLTTDLAPVVAAIVTKEAGVTRRGIGAASNDDVTAACLKAVREACVPLYFAKGEGRRAQRIVDTLKEPADHVELYASGDYDHLLLKLCSSTNVREFAEIHSFEGKITHRLHQKGFQIFIADIKARRLRELLPSVCVVRAIIPGLVPIYFGQNWARTRSLRIKTIPEEFGWKVDVHYREKYQRFPHPFP
jgi:thiazole/oxazole-forming peptide maturase SagD family component